MAVEFHEDTGKIDWFNWFHKQIETASTEAKEFFEAVKNDASNIKCDTNDKSLKRFRDEIDKSQFTLENYNNWLRINGENTTAFSNITKKAGTIVKSFGATLGSMAVMWAVGEVISWIAKGIDNFVHAEEKATERSKELNDETKRINEGLEENKKIISETSEEYIRLSKGVDHLGRNISLTAEEYKRYHEITNKIAEFNPNLVSGYDALNNPILTVKGNVEQLTAAYEENYKAAQADIKLKAPEAVKNNYKSLRTEREQYDLAMSLSKVTYEDLQKSARDFYLGTMGVAYDSKYGFDDNIIYDVLKKATINQSIIDEFFDTVTSGEDISKELYDKLFSSNNLAKIQAYTSQMESTLINSANDMRMYMNSYLAWDEDGFGTLDSKKQEIVLNLIPVLPQDFFNYEENADTIYQNLSDLLIKPLLSNDGAKIEATINALFAMTENNFNSSYYQYIEFLNAKLDELETFFPVDFITSLREKLGLLSDTNVVGNDLVQAAIDKVYTSANYTIPSDAKDVMKLEIIEGIKTLPEDSLRILLSLDIKGKSWADILNQIKTKTQEMNDAKGYSFDASNVDYTTHVDNAKSSITTLGDALVKLNSETGLTESEILELNKQFPELVGHSDDLDQAIRNLMESAKDSAVSFLTKEIESMGENNPARKGLLDTVDIIENMFKKANNAANGIKTLHSALNSLKSNAQVLAAVDEDMKKNNGNFSVDSLNSIISAYPKLEIEVAKYNNGLITSSELFSKLEAAYKDDQMAYTNAVRQKLEADVEFSNTVLRNQESKIKDLATAYDLDYEHWTTIEQAKFESEKNLITNLSNIWSKYYKVTKDSTTGKYTTTSILGNYDDSHMAGGVGDITLSKVDDAFETYNALIDELNGIHLNTDFDWKELSSGNGTGDNTEFSQTIDFISEKIKVTENNIKNLNATLENTSGIEAQIKLYGQLITEQSNLTKAYNSAAKSYETQYTKALDNKNLTKTDIDNIKIGSLTIEQFRGKGKDTIDEKRFNAIQEAIKLRDQLADIDVNYQNSIAGLTKYSNDLANIPWNNASANIDKINDKISLLNEELNNTTDYKKKNEKLDDILKERDAILKEYNKANEDTKTNAKTSFDLIDKKYRIGREPGEKISTDGVTNPDQLALIIQYNAQVDKLIEGTATLALEEEKLNSFKNETRSTKFEIKNAEIDKFIEKQSKLLSEIDNAIGFVDDNSIEQISLLQAGYEEASQKVGMLKAEISNLHEEYANGKGEISFEEYMSRLERLDSEHLNAAKAMQGYQNQIISAMRARYDEEKRLSEEALNQKLKDIETEKKAALDSLQAQIDDYKKIIDARKKALQDQEESDNYKEQIEEYNKTISKLQSRIERLKAAELSGDRTAGAERRELEEQLEEQKKSLAKLQKDRQVDLALDALDEEYTAYEDMKKQQMKDDEESFDKKIKEEKRLFDENYDIKEGKITKLYEDEKALIIEAAQLTSSEFSKAFEEINKVLAQYGVAISTDLSNALESNKVILSNSPSSSGSSATSNQNAIISLLKSGTSKSGDSALNKYVQSNYGSYLTFGEMVQLARMLGLTEINSEADVKGSSENREKIRKALISAGFEKGGIAQISSSNFTKNLTGGIEHGIALVRNGEGFVRPEDVSNIKHLLSVVPNINGFMNNIIPYTSSLTTNQNLAPVINFNLTGGTITQESMPQFNRWKSEIINEFSKIMIEGAKKR